MEIADQEQRSRSGVIRKVMRDFVQKTVPASRQEFETHMEKLSPGVRPGGVSHGAKK